VECKQVVIIYLFMWQLFCIWSVYSKFVVLVTDWVIGK